MKRLAEGHEHLDGPLTDPTVLAGNLHDLARINRAFGGVSLSRNAIDALAPGGDRPVDGPLRLLDVGTGGADIPLALIATWRGRGRPLTATAVDSRPEVLTAARVLHPDVVGEPGLRLEVADGRSLPYSNGSFHIAHASLVLHHLEPAEATALLREMARVASRGVVVNDLGRGWLPWLGAWLTLHLITRNRFTLHDGPLSVRRAYTLGEARQLMAEAGLQAVHQEVGLAGHRWALAAIHRDDP
ncbi:MAG: methyltransferase domain-containing protein [Chloroflexota bacterium]